ncbi:protein RGF1 INDUCIBLE TRANSCRIPTION FACTOR 1 [Medicago truncatula]|uniref:protein RGF1 INDUCIBLE TRANSCRIPTION FACTOR 1 n=1 Tax=Medicago truncatula TaxID=3880 RepID=UPI001967F3F0|nr:protein RGF1 INDUCIBLE TRANSCRIPTION FACTOR 1 [Medicago truncatula]
MVKRSLPNGKEDWLDALLMDRFGNCKNHKEKFNEKNVFCLDCGISFCRYDKESHSLHRKVQIYRYCYVDVAKYTDLLKYFDCSYIQTYISNNDKIVLIKPRPPKTSTSQKQAGGICEECGKQLQDKRNRFCSIKCKITIEELGINQDDHQNSEAESSISTDEPNESGERVNLRKRPRKSTPIRSISSFVNDY